MKKRTAIIGFAAIILLMSAGAAQSLPDENTVFTDDIAAGNVTASDIATDAVGGAKIKNGSVKYADTNFALKSTFSWTVAFPAETCQTRTIAQASGDFVADWVVAVTAPDNFPDIVTYHVENGVEGDLSKVKLVACNLTDVEISEGTFTFDRVTFTS